MAIYLIGDVQGCDSALGRLLQKIDFSPSRDTLYLLGDRIGLPPAGKSEKRRGFISGRQSRAALAEVLAWRVAGEQAGARPLDPNWPVAVITAGPADRMGPCTWCATRRAASPAPD